MDETNTIIQKNEQALLGLMIQNKEIANGAFEIVEPNDFYSSAHKKIAEIIKKLCKKEVDLLQVLLEAQREDCLIEIGGEFYLTELIEAAYKTNSWKFYAKTIKQNSLERKKQELSILIKNNPDNDIYVKELVKTQNEIDKLDFAQIDLRDWANSLRNEIFAEKNIIRTEYKGLDDSAMSGGDLVVVAARPGVGKSIFAANILNNFLKQGKKCLVYTTEMTPEQYMLRQICIYSNLWYFGFRNGYASESEKESLDEATTEFTDKYKDKLIYSQILRPSSNDIKREIEEYKPDIIILDNLSSVKLTSKSSNKTEKIGEFLEEVKEVIVEKKLLCIIVCHINRSAEKDDGNNEPILSNLKDSSKIEELANKVIILWPDEPTLQDMVINWKYSKDRDGLGGFGRLAINKNFLIMRDYNESVEKG